MIRGYRRADGRLGARNHVLVLPSVVCSGLTAQLIAGDDAISVTHQHGCAEVGDDVTHTAAVFSGMATNPNVGAALVVGLGCETIQGTRLAERIGEEGQRVRYAGIQADGGTAKTVARGRELLSGLQAEIGDARRERGAGGPAGDRARRSGRPVRRRAAGTDLARGRAADRAGGRGGRRAAPGARDGRRTGHRRLVRPGRGPARLRHLPRDLRVGGRGAVRRARRGLRRRRERRSRRAWPRPSGGTCSGCSTAAPRRRRRAARGTSICGGSRGRCERRADRISAPRRPLGHPQPRAGHARPRRREPRRRADRGRPCRAPSPSATSRRAARATTASACGAASPAS